MTSFENLTMRELKMFLAKLRNVDNSEFMTRQQREYLFTTQSSPKTIKPAKRHKKHITTTVLTLTPRPEKRIPKPTPKPKEPPFKGPIKNTGYRNVVLFWVVTKINDQTIFQSILGNQRCFNALTNLPFMLLQFYMRRLLIF